MVRTASTPVNERGRPIRFETAPMTFPELRYSPRDYKVQGNRVTAETEHEARAHQDGRFPEGVASTLREMGYETRAD